MDFVTSLSIFHLMFWLASVRRVSCKLIITEHGFQVYVSNVQLGKVMSRPEYYLSADLVNWRFISTKPELASAGRVKGWTEMVLAFTVITKLLLVIIKLLVLSMESGVNMTWCVDRTRIRRRRGGDQHGRAFGQNVHVASGRGGNLQSDPRRSHGVPRVGPERRRGADRHGRRPACSQSVCCKTRRPVRYLWIKSKLWNSSWCEAALSFTWDGPSLKKKLPNQDRDLLDAAI